MISYCSRLVGNAVQAILTGVFLAALGAVVGAILGAILGGLLSMILRANLGDATIFGAGFCGLAGTIPSMIKDRSDMDSDAGSALVVIMAVGAIVIGTHFLPEPRNNAEALTAILVGAILTAGSISAIFGLRSSKICTNSAGSNGNASRRHDLKKNATGHSSRQRATYRDNAAKSAVTKANVSQNSAGRAMVVSNVRKPAFTNRLNVSIYDYTRLPKLTAPAGYVYVIQEIEFSKLYKIGRTVDPKTRAYKVDLQTPGRIRVVALLKSNNAKDLEKRLHRRFSSTRQRGEWFNLSSSQVREIREM